MANRSDNVSRAEQRTGRARGRGSVGVEGAAEAGSERREAATYIQFASDRKTRLTDDD